MKSILGRYIIAFSCSLLISGLVAFAYGKEAKLVLSDIKIAPESAETEMTFLAEADGSVSVEGKMGTVLDNAHPGQSKVLNNMFHNSAIHHFKGKISGDIIERKNVWSGIQVNISGYIFEGSMDKPLTFQCVLGKGYVYIGGVGKVTLKDGKEIALGKENPQHNSQTSGEEPPLLPNATANDKSQTPGTEEQEWEKAKKTDTVEAYSKFLQYYPQEEQIVEKKEGFTAIKPNEKYDYAHERIVQLMWKVVLAKSINEFEAAQRFLKENPDEAQFATEIERNLISLIEKEPSLARTRPKLSVKLGSYRTSTAVTITQGENGMLDTKGTVESIMGGGSNMAGPDAIHRWKGTVKDVQFQSPDGIMQKYTFIGDEKDPLTFGCVLGVGYVYLHGKGKIILPDGNTIQAP